MKVTIKDSVLRQAAAEGMDAFLAAVVQAVKLSLIHI